MQIKVLITINSDSLLGFTFDVADEQSCPLLNIVHTISRHI